MSKEAIIITDTSSIQQSMCRSVLGAPHNNFLFETRELATSSKLLFGRYTVHCTNHRTVLLFLKAQGVAFQ